MQNPVTSWSGYVVLGVILFYVGWGFWTGHPMDLKEVLGILGGGAVVTGLIGAKDGGH